MRTWRPDWPTKLSKADQATPGCLEAFPVNGEVEGAFHLDAEATCGDLQAARPPDTSALHRQRRPSARNCLSVLYALHSRVPATRG